MKFGLKFSDFLENRAKKLTLLQLRKMDERQLLDCGISPVLLAQGVKAWPWRELEDKPTLSLQGGTPSVTKVTGSRPAVANSAEGQEKAAA